MVKKLQTKLILLLCLMVAGVSSAWGDATVSFTDIATSSKWSSNSYSKDNVTLAHSQGTSSSAPYQNGTQYRLYEGNTFTVSVSTGNLKSIRFKGSVRKASCVYAHSFISLKRKNGMSETPLN